MYWRAGKPERFVRPLRWMVALLDEEILPLEFAGVTAGRASYGHRVLHGNAPVVVSAPQAYARTLAAAYVEVDPAARRERIRKALDKATRKIPGARWREDEDLVEIVTNLTEWPSVILGDFEASYLDLPEEVLVTVMRGHQKYFALEDSEKKLLPNFLAVLNLEVDEAGADGDSPWKRAGAAGSIQRCTFFLGCGSENSTGRSGGDAEERHIPERSGQLLGQDGAESCGRATHHRSIRSATV